MKYEVFLIDPPWQKKKGGLRMARPNQTKQMDYETMPTKAIFQLLDEEVFSHADNPHCVFMWTIDEFLFACENQMVQRAYKRHCRFVWDRTNGVAPALTVRYSHEYLIWYYQPSFLPIAISQRGKFTTVLREQGRAHSRKPEAAYKMIEALYPDQSKLDVFSRQKRKGWHQFGNEGDYFKADSIVKIENCGA